MCWTKEVKLSRKAGWRQPRRPSVAASRAWEPCLPAMEASTHSPWLSRLIEDLGHECLVANPATLKGKNRKKSDKIDAEKLARWARSDPKLLEPIRHAGAEVQAD